MSEIYHQMNESMNIYFHGSMEKLPVGTILIPSPDYEQKWGNTDFYHILEIYRPKHMMSHQKSVFMCDNIDDIDLAGGGTEFIFTVQPLGNIEKHDLNWSSEISMLISDGHDIDSDDVIIAAENYWNGTPHYNESVWEYLTPRAKILKVEDY